MLKLKLNSQVKIVWADAVAVDTSWMEVDDLIECLPSGIITTIGFLISQDSKYYYLSMSKDTHNGYHAGVIKIPKGCVMEAKVIK